MAAKWNHARSNDVLFQTEIIMAEQNDIARVWEILEKNSTGMLTTRFSDGLRARPMDARPDREASAIFFLTDVRGYKDDEIAANPDVCYVVTTQDDNVYLSITGRASVARDTARAEKIWKKIDGIWWKGGPDDPNGRVLIIEPLTAELWDGPSNSLVAAFEFAKAKVTGEKPFIGENRKKTVAMG
jgi:general stress protein 26